MILRIITIIFPIIVIWQESNMICGTWLEEKKQSHIEIYQTDKNTYEGKIVWLAEPLNELGAIKLDKENPNKSLRHRTIQNLIIIENLQFIILSRTRTSFGQNSYCHILYSGSFCKWLHTIHY